jgi:hypothetical protein
VISLVEFLSEPENFQKIAALFLGFSISAFPLWIRVRVAKCSLKEEKQLNLVKARLDDYALMQNQSPDREDDNAKPVS